MSKFRVAGTVGKTVGYIVWAINNTLKLAKSATHKSIGYITSGGYAHYVKQSMALGYVPIELSKHETALEVEINGKIYKAKVTDKPLYDSNGGKMKS